MPKSLPALTNTRTLLGLAALAAMLCAIVLVACSGGGDDDDPIDVTTPTATEGATTSTATASSTPRATSTQTRTPTATSTEATRTDQPLPTAVAGADVLSSLRDLVSDHGYPSGTDFARIRIPALGVDAQIGSRYVGTDGVMPDPGGPADVVWYDLSAWAGMGGAPGGGGNAIFSGHVDYAANVPYAGVYYKGQGIFSQLGLLSDGDIIEIDYAGQTLRYAVVWRQQLGANGTDWGSIWSSDVPADSITLYTCGGAFDFDSLSYADRIVVRAQRIP